jgi:hypothetical protein
MRSRQAVAARSNAPIVGRCSAASAHTINRLIVVTDGRTSAPRFGAFRYDQACKLADAPAAMIVASVIVMRAVAYRRQGP